MSEQLQEIANPLDSVEEVLASHNWTFSRMTDDELMVQVAGKHCEYRLFFIWQEDMNAVQFCCQYSMNVARRHHDTAAIALMAINENLWMGHFDLPKDSGVPSFRQTCLLRGMDMDAGADQIEDMVDIALMQCERYYPVFQMLAKTGLQDDASLSLALMETAGES
jgi:hypothetical protein